MLILRDYQEKLVDQVRAEFSAGRKNVCIVSGCGSGKTVMMSAMSLKAKLKGNNVMFVVHRQELIEQASETFNNFGISHGIISAKYPMDLSENIQIASIQSVIRRLDKTKEPSMIILDEAHHATASTWKKLLEAFPQAYVVGLTATPARMGGQGLGDIFELLIMGPSVKELIDNKYLAPYRYYAPPQIANLEGVRVKMGDYDQKQIAEIMDDNTIIGDAVNHYKKLGDGKKAIVYCASIAHSMHTAQLFCEAGYNACHLDGNTHSAERSRITKGFRNGEIQIIVNCDLLGEGYDVPGAEVVILLRPTQSLTLYIQQSMRGMRIDKNNPDKVCIILDHVGNVARHGLPDTDHEWSLESKKKKSGAKSDFPLRQCPKCFYAHRPAPACPGCGHIYETAEREELEQRDGELAEVIELENLKRKEELRKARDVVSLEQIAMRRGYKPAWIKKQCELRHIPFGKKSGDNFGNLETNRKF